MVSFESFERTNYTPLVSPFSPSLEPVFDLSMLGGSNMIPSNYMVIIHLYKT